VIEPLPSQCEALSSSPSITKKKKSKKGKKTDLDSFFLTLMKTNLWREPEDYPSKRNPQTCKTFLRIAIFIHMA
jgi:hypothetical protein